MAISFACESCGHRFQVAESFAGKKGKCKTCGHVFIIPSAGRAGDSPDLRTFGMEKGPVARQVPVPEKPQRHESNAHLFDEIDNDADPYVLKRAVAPPSGPKSSSFEDEEFIAPRRARPLVSKARHRTGDNTNAGIPFFDGIPGRWYLYFFGVIAVLTVWAIIHPPSGGILLALALGLGIFGTMMYGGIGILVIPFQESAACGLMCIFVPIYPLYYLLTRWDAMKGAVLSYFSGIGMLIGTALLAFLLLPAIVASRDAANRAVLQDQARQNAPINPVERNSDEVNGDAPPPVVLPGQGNFSDIAKENAKKAREIASAGRGLAQGKRQIPGSASPFSGLPGGLPRFGAPQGIGQPMPGIPQPPANPNESITVTVKGLVDDDTRDLFNEKFTAMVQGSNPKFHFLGSGVGEQMSYTVWPVTGVKEFADQIDFARVEEISGRKVVLLMSPAQGTGNRPDAGDFVGQILFDLKAPSANKRKDALRRLMSSRPDEDLRADVAKGIEPLLKDSDGWIRTDAAKALAIWGVKETMPSLIGALSDQEFGVRWAVLDTIKTLKDPAAAQALTAMVVENKDRHQAVDALKTMGPEAEPLVLKLLDNGDVFVRMEGCKILQELGTSLSVPALQKLLQKTNGFGLDAMAARETLKRINAPERPSSIRKKSGVDKGR